MVHVDIKYKHTHVQLIIDKCVKLNKNIVRNRIQFYLFLERRATAICYFDGNDFIGGN
jgi:hypothetical protein